MTTVTSPSRKTETGQDTLLASPSWWTTLAPGILAMVARYGIVAGVVYGLLGAGLWLKVAFDNDITYDWTWGKVAFLIWGLTGVLGILGYWFARFPNLTRSFHPSLWSQTDTDVAQLPLVLVLVGLFGGGGILLGLNALGLYSAFMMQLDRIPKFGFYFGFVPFCVFCLAGIGGVIWAMVSDMKNDNINQPYVSTPKSRRWEAAGMAVMIIGICLPIYLAFLHVFAFEPAGKTDDWVRFSHHEPGQENGFMHAFVSRGTNHISFDYGPLSLESVPVELETLREEVPDFEDRIRLIKDRRDWSMRKLINVTDSVRHVWMTEAMLSLASCKMAVEKLPAGYEIVSINGDAGGHADSCRYLVYNQVKVRSLPHAFP
jgi:hypothetical protein